MTHPTIAKTEKGERSVTLDETLALAAALDVSPSRLFLPTKGLARVAITPERVVSPRVARQWVRGQQPLPGQDEQTFRTDVSDDERQAMQEISVQALLHEVQSLVTATIREDRNAMADAVDAINDELERLRSSQGMRAS
jgi:transcriptional regulator with XRE-family HTH domain